MKQLFLLFLLIISASSFSQNQFNSEDLSVTRYDLSMNTYEKDSTANALVLYEYGNSYIDKSTFKLVTEVKQKLKILNREGFDYAKTEVFLYGDGKKKEKISNISATTFNLVDQTITKTVLDKSQIFEQKFNENYTIVKFAHPDVKIGSVITYSYTLETPFMFKFKEWYFQSNIPTLYSQYKTSIPGNYEYNIKLVGLLKFDVADSEIEKNCLQVGNGGIASCVNSNYIMRNIPAFQPEEFMTTKNNYLARIEYELKTFNGFDGSVDHYTKSWKTVDSELKSDQNLGKQLNKTGGFKNLLDASVVNESNPLKKATNIYKFVQDTYTWNTKYEIFKDVSIKNLMDNKSGKVSEINILLHNLMDENGLDVKPVLLSTRTNGFATKIYPVLSDFNYVIVQLTIDGKTYLLDATDKYLAFGQLPYRCLNQYGRLLDFKNGSSWIDIAAADTSTIQYRLELNLNADATISGLVKQQSSGYHALPLKSSYFENRENYIKSKNDQYNTIEFSDYHVKTNDQTDFQFNEEFRIKLETSAVGDNIYLNPFLFKFFSENMFKLQERTYPIDFGYQDSYAYSLKLDIDEGYEILERPQDVALKLPNNTGTIIFNSQLQNNSLLLFFKLNFNDSIYYPEYYNSIKEFMNTVVDIQKNTLIVIKKK